MGVSAAAAFFGVAVCRKALLLVGASDAAGLAAALRLGFAVRLWSRLGAGFCSRQALDWSRSFPTANDPIKAMPRQHSVAKCLCHTVRGHCSAQAVAAYLCGHGCRILLQPRLVLAPLGQGTRKVLVTKRLARHETADSSKPMTVPCPRALIHPRGLCCRCQLGCAGLGLQLQQVAPGRRARQSPPPNRSPRPSRAALAAAPPRLKAAPGRERGGPRCDSRRQARCGRGAGGRRHAASGGGGRAPWEQALGTGGVARPGPVRGWPGQSGVGVEGWGWVPAARQRGWWRDSGGGRSRRRGAGPEGLPVQGWALDAGPWGTPPWTPAPAHTRCHLLATHGLMPCMRRTCLVCVKPGGRVCYPRIVPWPALCVCVCVYARAYMHASILFFMLRYIWSSKRERESLHLSSHTGLMQVLPGHTLADSIIECFVIV